jgi:hypothetical protein
MRRGLWFVAGAGAGIYGMVRGRRAAEALTVDGLKDRLSGLEVGARLFRDEVAQARIDKETELRERYGLVPHGRPELEGGRHRAAAAPGTPSTTPISGPMDTPVDSPTASTDEEGTP